MALIMTSKLGTFTFNEDTILSHAKLVRDSITGAFFNPKPGEPKITSNEDAQDYGKHNLGMDLSTISFSLFINPVKDKV